MNTKWLKRVSAVLLACCLLCGLMTLYASAVTDPPADGKGSVTITSDKAFEGVPLLMVEIGSFKDMIITPNETFREFDLEDMMTAREYVEMAGSLEEFVKKNHTPGVYSWVDYNGRTVFSGVDVDKAYLIVQAAGAELVTIQPIIVTVPRIVDGEAEYNVELTAKYEDNRDKDYQGAVILNKIGYENARLEGAEFSFWQKVYVTDVTTLPEGSEVGVDSMGSYYWKRLGGVLTTDEHGQISITKLPFGLYRFIEEKAPDGYMLNAEPHEFPISVHGTVKTENELYVEDVKEVVELTVTNERIPTTSQFNSEPDDSSQPTSTPTYSSTPESSTPDTPPDTHLTGEDIAKFVIIFSAVGVSLVVVILLLALGARKNKNK